MRKIKTPTGYTKMTKYSIGVKQGCILSPNFFTLFMKELGERLLNTGLGIKIGKIKIPALFFADDIIIFAENEEEAKILMTTIMEFIKERNLLINKDKTKIITRGRKKGNYEKIEEFLTKDSFEGFLKYLGIKVSEGGNIWKIRREDMVNKMRNKINAMESIARNTVDPVNMTELIWNGEVIPAGLYGCEMVTMTKQVLEKLEKLQGDTLRKLFKATKSTNIDVLRQEIGWMSTTGLIYKRKINFWRYLMKLPDDRWAKQVYEESRELKTDWYNEIRDIRIEMGITMECLDINKDRSKKYIHDKIKKWENRRNKERIETKKSLQHYRYELKKRQAYINNNKNWVEISKFRTGQLDLINKIRKIEKCKFCKENETDLKHILIKCDKINESNEYRRLTEKVKEIKRRDRHIKDEQIVEELLMRWHEEIGEELKLMWKTIDKTEKDDIKKIKMVKTNQDGSENWKIIK
jgi:hypothetical protein